MVQSKKIFFGVLILGLFLTVCAMQEDNEALQIQQEEYNCSFVRAAHYGNLKLMQWYLREHIVDVNCLGADDATALMIAVEDDKFGLVIELLKTDNINVNTRTHAHWSALDFAIFHQREMIVEVLLRSGAELGVDLLPTAFCGEFPSISTLMLAAWVGNPVIFRMLPKTIDTLNQANSYSGWIPLMFAVSNNKPEAVAELISEGADVNAVDTDGWTALMLAAWSGYADIVERLLAAHARTGMRDIHFGRNAFDWACEGYRRTPHKLYIPIIRSLNSRKLKPSSPAEPKPPPPSAHVCGVM